MGTPYKKHKCSRCKSVYVYHIGKETMLPGGLIHCPVCGNYLDMHLFDVKVSKEKYEKIGESDSNEN
jgi:transcription elongation factor Elf1